MAMSYVSAKKGRHGLPWSKGRKSLGAEHTWGVHRVGQAWLGEKTCRAGGLRLGGGLGGQGWVESRERGWPWHHIAWGEGPLGPGPLHRWDGGGTRVEDFHARVCGKTWNVWVSVGFVTPLF